MRRVTPTRVVSIAIAAICLALGGYLARAQRSEHALARAQDAVAAGDPAAALARLNGLGGQAADRADAVRADAHIAQHRYGDAHHDLSAALRHDPNDWVLVRDDAVVLLALGRRPAAKAEMQRALALNPRMDLPPGFVAAAG